MPDITASFDGLLLATPQILSTVPPNAQTGVALTQNVTLEFSQAVDKDSVTQGHFIIISAANKVAATGPGLFAQLLSNNLVAEDLLSTPSMRGIVQGTITWDEEFDTFVLNPAEQLEPNVQYTAIASEEIVSRTLTDPVADPGNTGTGTMNVEGPYSGTWVADLHTVEITTGGALTSAVFRWRKASDPVWRTGIVLDRRIEIEDGIVLRFGAGVYDAGDEFTFYATLGIPLDATYTFVFTTGSATYVVPSVQEESNEVLLEQVGGIVRIVSSPTPAGVGFRVLSVDPPLQATDVDLTQKEIRITFNRDLDPATVDDDSVQVFMETLPTDHNERRSEPLRKHMTVAGRILTISLDGV